MSMAKEVSSVPFSAMRKGIYPSFGPRSQEAETIINLRHLFRDIFKGPLKGERATILMAKTLDDRTFGANDFLKGLNNPVHIVRISKEPEMDLDPAVRRNFSETQLLPLLDSNYFNDGNSNLIIFPKGGVVVLVSSEDDRDLKTVFTHPPKGWSAKALLVISLAPSCYKKYFLQSPLMQITPSATLICPSVLQGNHRRGHVFKVWSWYPLASGQKLVSLGNWRGDRFQSWGQLFVDRFRDMSEKTIKILAINIDRPFYYERENGESAGQTFKIVEALGQWLSYKIKIKGGVHIDYRVIEGKVDTGENDLMFNLATPTTERNERFQMTVPYAYEGFGLMLEIPPPLPRWMNIIYPYSAEVWIWTIVSLFATSATFHVLYRHKESSFITNTIISGQSLLSNPLAIVPEGWDVRCFLLIWWVGSWMLNLSYTCNLIAILTVPAFPTRIQTAQELSQSHYRLCMLDYGEFVPEALATSDQASLFALGAKMDMVPIVETLPEMGEEACVERVLRGTHSHIESYPYAATLYPILNLNSKVYALKEHLYQSHLVIIIYKHAPWKYKYDIGMAWLTEAGLVQKWYQDAMDEYQGKPVDDESAITLTALSLSHLQGPFYLFGIGLFTSLLILGGEILIPPKKE